MIQKISVVLKIKAKQYSESNQKGKNGEQSWCKSPSRLILIGIPKHALWIDSIDSGLSVWVGAGGNTLLETCNIANHEVGVFKKLPPLQYAG